MADLTDRLRYAATSRPGGICEEAANEIERLRAWIADHGLQTDTCTRNVLGEVCKYCQCKHRKAK